MANNKETKIVINKEPKFPYNTLREASLQLFGCNPEVFDGAMFGCNKSHSFTKSDCRRKIEGFLKKKAN